VRTVVALDREFFPDALTSIKRPVFALREILPPLTVLTVVGVDVVMMSLLVDCIDEDTWFLSIRRLI